MRLLFFVLLIFSFDVQSKIPEPGYGLPELASEARIKELNSKKRAKVMTPSVQRKMQRVLEALDEAGILEQEQALLKKEKKDKEAEAKDKEIAKAIANGQRELDDLKTRLASLQSYDRSMYYYYSAYYNLAYQDKISEAMNNYVKLVAEKDTAEKLRVNAYYVLAQLYLSESNYESGLDYLLRWFKNTAEVNPDGYVLLGQAYYLLADKESTKSLKKIINERVSSIFGEELILGSFLIKTLPIFLWLIIYLRFGN